MADGTVIWNCLQTVQTRVARHSFGIGVLIPYDPANLSHHGREQIPGLEVVSVGGSWGQVFSKVTEYDIVRFRRQNTTDRYVIGNCSS